MYNQENFTENVEYCLYIASRNESMNLGLESARDIQTVANEYCVALENLGIDADQETVENDDVLVQVVDAFRDERNVPEDYDSVYDSSMSLNEREEADSRFKTKVEEQDPFKGSDEEENTFHM